MDDPGQLLLVITACANCPWGDHFADSHKIKEGPTSARGRTFFGFYFLRSRQRLKIISQGPARTFCYRFAELNLEKYRWPHNTHTHYGREE